MTGENGSAGAPDASAEEPLTLYLVKRLELVVRSLLDEALRPLGLTTTQYTALSVLRRRDGLSSAQLARRSFLRPQTMHELVVSLERRGLVERRHSQHNRRVLLVGVTDTGLDLLRACEPAVRDIEARLLAGLPADRRREFRGMLAAGHDALAHLAHERA